VGVLGIRSKPPTEVNGQGFPHPDFGFSLTTDFSGLSLDVLPVFISGECCLLARFKGPCPAESQDLAWLK